jgi:hypothetical protein
MIAAYAVVLAAYTFAAIALLSLIYAVEHLDPKKEAPRVSAPTPKYPEYKIAV